MFYSLNTFQFPSSLPPLIAYFWGGGGTDPDPAILIFLPSCGSEFCRALAKIQCKKKTVCSFKLLNP